VVCSCVAWLFKRSFAAESAWRRNLRSRLDPLGRLHTLLRRIPPVSAALPQFTSVMISRCWNVISLRCAFAERLAVKSRRELFEAAVQQRGNAVRSALAAAAWAVANANPSRAGIFDG